MTVTEGCRTAFATGSPRPAAPLVATRHGMGATVRRAAAGTGLASASLVEAAATALVEAAATAGGGRPTTAGPVMEMGRWTGCPRRAGMRVGGLLGSGTRRPTRVAGGGSALGGG